jgi:hypothetical protein
MRANSEAQLRLAQRRRERAQKIPWYVRFGHKADGAVMMGDMWMVASTQLLTNVISSDQLLHHTPIALAIWVCVAGARGDYTEYAKMSEGGSYIMGWTVYQGVLQACFTWLFFTPAHLLVLAVCVSQGWLDPAPIMDVELGAKVSPVLEVDVALLITTTTWRAFYYGVREGLL